MLNPFRILIQMWRYHTSIDVEKALKQTRWDAIQAGRELVNANPYCDLHNNPRFDEPLVVIAPGIFICEQCRKISEPAIPVRRPTRRLDSEQPIPGERPLLDYLHSIHPDASSGLATNEHRAVHLPQGYRTGAMRRIEQTMREQ
jgi:hypothetical protein